VPTTPSDIFGCWVPAVQALHLPLGYSIKTKLIYCLALYVAYCRLSCLCCSVQNTVFTDKYEKSGYNVRKRLSIKLINNVRY
jgi:hypothetical protein